MLFKSLAPAVAVLQLASAQELMRFGCSQLVIDRVDPLVNPGVVPAPHMHQVRSCASSASKSILCYKYNLTHFTMTDYGRQLIQFYHEPRDPRPPDSVDLHQLHVFSRFL